MPAFTWPASYSASVEVAPRVTRAAFGDGYEQRVAAGPRLRQHRLLMAARRPSAQREPVGERGGKERRVAQ